MSDDDDAAAPEHRRLAVQWKPGQSGNPAGRPKGSRNKLGEEFIQALYADFMEHGPAAIKEVREKKPDAYMKVIASTLPAHLNVNVHRDLSDDELDRRIRQFADALDLEIRAGGNAGGEETPIRH